MKEKIKKIFFWIKDNLVLFGSIGSIIVSAEIVWNVVKGVIAKMPSLILHIIGSGIFFSLSIILFIIWIRQRERRLLRKERTLKSELGDKTKQYDELVKEIESGLEKKIQLQHNLEYKAQHNRGEEPKITVWQKFSNASDFEFKIKRIDTIATLKGEAEIERFHYDESDNLFLDKQKLFFPKKIASLDGDNEITYRINDITKLVKAFPYYKRRAFLIEVEQAIEFATQATTTSKTVKKTVKKTVNIQPEDWKGGRR